MMNVKMKKSQQQQLKKYIVKISDKAALLSDSSNSGGDNSGNDECTLTKTNPSRTASMYCVNKELPFSNGGRIEG